MLFYIVTQYTITVTVQTLGLNKQDIPIFNGQVVQVITGPAVPTSHG